MMMMDELGRKLFNRVSLDLAQADVGQLIEEKETRSKPFWSKIFSIKTK